MVDAKGTYETGGNDDIGKKILVNDNNGGDRMGGNPSKEEDNEDDSGRATDSHDFDDGFLVNLSM